MKGEDYRDFVHAGPGTLAGRYLRSFWQPVFKADALEPGRPQRIHIMDEWFTLYRGEGGSPYLVEDRCPHRGTQLSLGWVEGECIRCFYHGWMYDGSGACVEQPAEKEAFAAKIRLRAYPVEEYLGLVFAYLGEGDAPPLPRYPELEDESIGPLMVRPADAPCNYFQRVENDVDEVHVQFVHKGIAERVDMRAVPHITAEETEYGFDRVSVRDDGKNKIVRRAHFLMPNALLVMVSPVTENDDWSVHLAWRVPTDDENCLSVAVSRIRNRGGGAKPQGMAKAAKKTAAEPVPGPREMADRIMREELRIQDVGPDYPYLFQVQDNVVLMGQGPIADRDNERLGQSDIPIILLRKIWERELKALAEGGALKQWRRPAEKLDVGATPQEQLTAASAGV